MLELYKNIKSRRIEIDMSQETLAEKTGYSDKGMISRIENGKVDLPLSKIELFAIALRTTCGDLMGWEEQSNITTLSTTSTRYKELLEVAEKLNDDGLTALVGNAKLLLAMAEYQKEGKEA